MFGPNDVWLLERINFLFVQCKKVEHTVKKITYPWTCQNLCGLPASAEAQVFRTQTSLLHVYLTMHKSVD